MTTLEILLAVWTTVATICAIRWWRSDRTFAVGFDPEQYPGLEHNQCKCCRVWTEVYNGWCWGCHGDMRKVDGMFYEREREIEMLRRELERQRAKQPFPVV